MTTGLTRLCLQEVSLQPEQTQQGGALGTSQLLLLLSRLTALRELKLFELYGDWPQQQLAQFSALTASSNLQELWIRDCDMPGAAWVHMFPAGRQLPKLHTVTMDWDDDNPPAAFDSTAIARLASCCLAVKGLVFTPAADASVAPLKSLSALTHVSIGSVSPAAIRSDLTALTQLQSLEVSVLLPAAGAGEDASSGLQHLLPLTALSRLQTLVVYGKWRAAGADEDAPSELQHLVPLTALTGLTWLYIVPIDLEYKSQVSDWHELQAGKAVNAELKRQGRGCMTRLWPSVYRSLYL
jgi:hypothetical protein